MLIGKWEVTYLTVIHADLPWQTFNLG